MLKLSQTKRGKQYKIERLMSFKSLSKRLAILGLNSGVMIEILAIYKHGALINTSGGKIAVGADLLDSIMVTII